MSILVWIWNGLKRIAIWIWNNPVALAAMAGSVIGAYFMWKSRRNRISSLEDAVRVQAIKKSIAKAEGQIELLKQQADSKEPEIRKLEHQVRESKRHIMELHEGVALPGMSDQEVADMFSDSGL